MRNAQDVVELLEGQPVVTSALQTVARLGIDDCWVGAGLVRNAVWDHLHGRAIEVVAGSDVDVVYFDDRSPSLAADVAMERRLVAASPHIPWSVHNQARMHERNIDAPYLNCEDAIRCWPETATAIALRLWGEQLQLMAPYGVDDLLGLVVRPTPPFRRKMAIYERRLASKNWASRWPLLKFVSE